MNTKEEFKTIKDLVLKLLATEERCRNDDKYLTYRVFETIAKQHGKGVFIPFDLWAEFPAFETVKRTRAYIQNTLGLYQPTIESVKDKRTRREAEVKEWLK